MNTGPLERHLARSGGCAVLLLTAVVCWHGAVSAAAPRPATVMVTGSESLMPLLEHWSADFRQQFPDTTLRLQAGEDAGSAAALADAAADLAAMSRPMDLTEVQAFRARNNGMAPVAVRVALDAVVIIVNALNPLQELTLAQVDGIFSARRRCGRSQDITTWGQILPSGVWHARPLQLIGLNALSGTHRYLRENALCGGEFKHPLSEKTDPREVVDAVRDAANAVGYVPMAFVGAGVRALPLSVGGTAVTPVAGNIVSGAYPLSRNLYLYLANPGARALPEAAAQFVSLALSVRGQRRVAQAGFVALPAAVASQEMAKLR